MKHLEDLSNSVWIPYSELCRHTQLLPSQHQEHLDQIFTYYLLFCVCFLMNDSNLYDNIWKTKSFILKIFSSLIVSFFRSLHLFSLVYTFFPFILCSISVIIFSSPLCLPSTIQDPNRRPSSLLTLSSRALTPSLQCFGRAVSRYWAPLSHGDLWSLWQVSARGGKSNPFLHKSV